MIEEVNKIPSQERSVGELVSNLTDELGRLVRDEIRLAVYELQRKGIRAGVGIGLMGAAGVLAWLGVAALTAAAVLALTLVMAGWLAALIVAGALFAGAGLFALVGSKQVKRAVPPVPEEAISGLRGDIEAVRQGVHS